MTNQARTQETDFHNVKPGRVWYVIAGLLFLVGTIGGVAILFSSIFSSFTDGTQFIVPGEVIVNVERPGKYTLWNEIRTIYRGRMYTGSEELPDMMEIRITDMLTDTTIPLESSSNFSETTGSTERRAFGNIHFDKPGRYKIEISGDFSERIFLVRRSFLSDLLRSIAAFVLLSIIGWIVAPVIAIVVIARRTSAKKKMPKRESPVVVEHVTGTTGAPASFSDAEKTWATFCHLSALSVYFFPLANIIVPLVLWLIKKDEMPLVNDQGKESLNFQLSMTLYYIISAILIIAIIGFVFLIGLGIFNLIVVIIASVKANKGEKYRYPLCIRFIR